MYSWSISLLPPILLDNRFGVNKLFDISGSGAAQAAHEMTRGCRKICDLRQGLCSKETDMRLRAFPTYNGPGSNHANGSPSNSQVHGCVSSERKLSRKIIKILRKLSFVFRKVFLQNFAFSVSMNFAKGSENYAEFCIPIHRTPQAGFFQLLLLK